MTIAILFFAMMKMRVELVDFFAVMELDFDSDVERVVEELTPAESVLEDEGAFDLDGVDPTDDEAVTEPPIDGEEDGVEVGVDVDEMEEEAPFDAEFDWDDPVCFLEFEKNSLPTKMQQSIKQFTMSKNSQTNGLGIRWRCSRRGRC